MSYRVQFPAAVDSFGLSTDNATRNASIVDGYPTLECALYAISEIEMRLGTGPLAVEYGGTGVASLEELALVALPASSDSRAYLRRVGGDLSFDIPTVLGESAATLGNLECCWQLHGGRDAVRYKRVAREQAVPVAASRPA